MKYEILSSVPSIDRNTGQQYVDQYGNLSWNITATDEQKQSYSFLKRTKQGNPAPKVGDILEGKVTLETGKSGNTYYKFTAEKKEFSGGGGKSFSDPNTMLISYAKDIVVALINNQGDKTRLTTENIKDDITTLTYHFKGLYDELKQTTTEAPKTPQTAPQSQEQAPLPSDNEIDIDEIPF